jgi:hypothetical protein
MRRLKPTCGWPCRVMNNRVFYRCTVDDCPLRYVQEVYCVECAQTNEEGHSHDHVYMDDSDPYLVKYRQDVEAMKREGACAEDDDDDSITVGGDSADMASFFNEILAARQQYQLMKEGRTEEIQPTEQ